MASQSMQLITPEEFACFEGMKLLEKLLLCGQLVPAKEIKDALLKAKPFELTRALLVSSLTNLESACQFLQDVGDYTFVNDNAYGWFNPPGNCILDEAVSINCLQRVDCLLTLHKTLQLFSKEDISHAAGLAAATGHAECLQLLVNVMNIRRQSARIRKLTGGTNSDDANQLILYQAVRRGNIDCIRLLLDCGFHVDPDWKDVFFPLFITCYHSHLEVLKLLFEADIYQGPLSGRITLPDTPSFCSLDCAKELIQSGVSVNCPDMDLKTPLHIAVSDGQAEIASMLIEHGADLEAMDLDGSTPLHLAVKSDSTTLVPLLIAAGANTNAKDGGGRSLQELAKSDSVRALLPQ